MIEVFLIGVFALACTAFVVALVVSIVRGRGRHRDESWEDEAAARHDEDPSRSRLGQRRLLALTGTPGPTGLPAPTRPDRSRCFGLPSPPLSVLVGQDQVEDHRDQRDDDRAEHGVPEEVLDVEVEADGA